MLKFLAQCLISAQLTVVIWFIVQLVREYRRRPEPAVASNQSGELSYNNQYIMLPADVKPEDAWKAVIERELDKYNMVYFNMTFEEFQTYLRERPVRIIELETTLPYILKSILATMTDQPDKTYIHLTRKTISLFQLHKDLWRNHEFHFGGWSYDQVWNYPKYLLIIYHSIQLKSRT